MYYTNGTGFMDLPSINSVVSSLLKSKQRGDKLKGGFRGQRVGRIFIPRLTWGSNNLFPISGETLEMQTTREIPDLGGIELPEGYKIAGFFKNGAEHLLLSTRRGLVACLKKKDGTLGKEVKVATSTEFVDARKSRYTNFFLCLASDPGRSGLDLVFQSDKELHRNGFNLVCTGSSQVRVTSGKIAS